MKNIIGTIIAVVIAVAIGGAYFFPKVELAGPIAGSSAGATFSTSKIASQVITTATTTVFAINNTDTSDRVINAADFQIAGANSTTTSYSVACATSTSASSLQSNTNYILNTTLSANIYGTTTGAGLYVASSSPGITGTSTASTVSNNLNPYARRWAAGSYLVCQVTTGDGYNAFTSGTTGEFTFPYRNL